MNQRTSKLLRKFCVQFGSKKFFQTNYKRAKRDWNALNSKQRTELRKDMTDKLSYAAR